MSQQHQITLIEQNITVSVDSVVFGYTNSELQILLIKRTKEPFKNTWAIPGGLLTKNQAALDAALNTLKTKAGVKINYLEQLFTFDELQRDPRSRTIAIAYFALINPNHYEISTQTKSYDAAWFSLNDLPLLAFDHKQIIETAITRLRGKISYQPIGFELLDKEFTLSELQKLYEVILNSDLDKRNFRKKIISTNIVTNTGKKRTGLRNRAPELYSFNKKEYEKIIKSGFNFKIV